MSTEKQPQPDNLSGFSPGQLIAALRARGYEVEIRSEPTSNERLVAKIGHVQQHFLGQYDLAQTALKALGFSETQIPSKDQVRTSLATLPVTGIDFLYERISTRQHDRLVMGHTIRELGLLEREQHNVASLIERFDTMMGTKVKTMHSVNWNTYSPYQLDAGQRATWPLAVFLGDITQPGQPTKPANNYDDDGLVYTRLAATQQKQFIDNEAARAGLHGMLIPVRIGELVVLNTMRRLEGKLLLGQIPGQEHRRPQDHTITRLLTYPLEHDSSGYSFSAILTANSYSGVPQMELSRGEAGRTWDVDGCRRVIQLPAILNDAQ